MKDKALQWLKYKYKINTNNIDILIQHTSAGEVLYFYNEDTWEDLNTFLTVPMLKELKEGKNIKKIKNKYKIKT